MITHQKHTRKNAGFTLIEVLVSVVLSGILLSSAFASFQGILRSQVRLSGVINIQRNLFYLNEKLSSLIQKGGTIDYEEYFNRRILGYEKSLSDTGWMYTKVSRYGNGDTASSRPQLYFCGVDSTDNDDICLDGNNVSKDETGFDESLTGLHVGYGQYAQLGYNYGSQSGFPTPMKLPPIFPASNTELQKKLPSELYLIKKLTNNSYERTYFRHIYIADPGITGAICDPDTSITGCLGKLQMTRLVSCDFLPAGGDGIVDVWIPHSDFGGEKTCTITDENEISTAADNLIWADISSPDMNITHAHFLPSPQKIPSKMAGAGEQAISPMIQIHLEVQLSESTLSRGLLGKSDNTPRFLTTSFDLDTL